MSPNHQELSAIPVFNKPIETRSLQDIVLQALNQGVPGLIVRCENLPDFKSDACIVLNEALGKLLQMITKCPTSSKLFLYVDHEMLADENGSLLLRLFTNLIPDESWKTQAEPELQAVQQVLEPLGSRLMFDIRNSGCLFSILLLGKL